MTPRALKDTAYGELARVSGALANPRRLEILDALTQRPHAVEAIADQIGQSVANTSQHLQVLRRARLVERERMGVRLIYRLAPGVAPLLSALRQLAEARLTELAAIEADFLSAHDAPPPIPPSELAAGLRSGEIALLDVRPADEFAAGHLPGARSIPLDALDERAAALPGDQLLVAYCRGPWCGFAIEAAARLRDRGLRARHCRLGVADAALLEGLAPPPGAAAPR